METNETKIAKLRALTADIEQRHAAIHNRLGVSEDEFARAKAARAKPSAPISGKSKDFNLMGQFSSDGARAIVAANAGGKFLPIASRDDFSDDRSNADDGETSESHRVGYASDLLNCQVAGNVDCVHGDVDHVAKAVDCLTGYMADDAMRKRNLADAGRAHTVRFASND